MDRLKRWLRKAIRVALAILSKLFKAILIIICLIPIIVIPLIPSTVQYIEEARYPEDNFVKIYLISMSDVEFSDTGMTEEGYPDVYEGQASGMAIASDAGKTYVLTADHFCQNFEEMSLNLGSILTIYDFQGNQWDAKIVMQDSSKDLCLIETNMSISREISVADRMPNIGDTVHTIAAPLGIGGNNAVPHFNGLFSGCDDFTCYFALPAAPGSSGSLILNDNGEIVGMTQMATHNMQNIGMGVGAYSIRRFLTRAELELAVDLL
mgnify:FL=1